MSNLVPGTVLAGFRIEAPLGRGGMGAVYLATQLRLGRKVAFKVLSPDLAEDEEFRARFIRESELAASLEHPNVLPVYDAGDADGVLYLAMRHVEGSDLRAVLREQGRLSPKRTLAIVRQVAGALDAAHEAGLVHRDVKPANILIGKSDHAYLSDFGVAKRFATAGMTRTGSFLGTVDYCSPEQIDGQALEGRADVYSLGCVTFHCLAGQPPFQRETEVAVIKAHLADPPPALSTVRPGLPLALDGVIVTAMAKHPEARFQTAGMLAGALDQAVSGTSTWPGLGETVTDGQAIAGETVIEVPASAPSLDRTAATTPMRHRRRRLWLFAVGAAAAVLAVGGGVAAVLALHGSSSPQKMAPRTTTAPTTSPATTSPPPSEGVSTQIAPHLAEVGDRQRVVTARVQALKAGVQSFRRLKAAGEELGTTLSRAEGALDTLTPRTSEDSRILSASRQALAAHLAYTNRVKQIPDLPRLFTKSQAQLIISAAGKANLAYARLSDVDETLPHVDISSDDHQRLVTVTATLTAQPRYFASVDRLQHCYVTARLARCGSGPSGEVMQLRAGGPAVYLGRLGSEDKGGPALALGEAVTSPGGAIRCESSSHGISCTDRSSGAAFTIGDYRHVLSNGQSTDSGASSSGGVPSTYTGSFTSVDRLQHCYATNDYVRCGSGPSGQAVELQSGVGVRYLGVIGSSDRGGPAMAMGTAFNTPTRTILCNSSSHGITCTDAITHETFTIGDHYVGLNGARITG